MFLLLKILQWLASLLTWSQIQIPCQSYKMPPAPSTFLILFNLSILPHSLDSSPFVSLLFFDYTKHASTSEPLNLLLFPYLDCSSLNICIICSFTLRRSLFNVSLSKRPSLISPQKKTESFCFPVLYHYHLTLLFLNSHSLGSDTIYVISPTTSTSAL